jgi:hypothetical protein
MPRRSPVAFVSAARMAHFGDQQVTDYPDRQSSPFRPSGHAVRQTRNPIEE